VAVRPEQLVKLAEILGVPIEELMTSQGAVSGQRRGPVGRAKQAFETVSRLPRHHQQRILAVVEAFVAQHSTTE
jgi:hypothetical protein